jgi:hypothetical protein
MAKMTEPETAKPRSANGRFVRAVAKPQPAVALADDSPAQMERRMIDRWVSDHLINWPPDNCLHCRQRVLPGQDWIDVANGTARARFHRECERKWRGEQETLARQTIGLTRTY